jgi:hypothetical protein
MIEEIHDQRGAADDGADDLDGRGRPPVRSTGAPVGSPVGIVLRLLGHRAVNYPTRRRSVPEVITVDDVRRITSTLPRSYEVVVGDRIKFRIGRIVYLAFSRDESVMGFAFLKEERAGLVASEPGKFMLPRPSDMRYNWVHVRCAEIDLVELREIVIEAWRMCVPKKVAAELFLTQIAD